MDSAELLCLSHQFELQAEADEAILSISREALVATPQTLKTVFLRFLVVLAEALRDKYQDPAMLLSVRSLYQTTLSSYVSKCTPKRPRKPTLNRKAFGCGFCAPCRSLDAFTTSSTVTWDYKPGTGNAHTVAHIKNQIKFGEFETSVLTTCSPRGLRITKHTRFYDSQAQKWLADCNLMTRTMQHCGVEMLQSLLGEHYQDIMSLRPIPIPAAAAPPPPVAAPPVQTHPAAVWDLTGDSDEEPELPPITNASQPLYMASGVPNTPLGPANGNASNHLKRPGSPSGQDSEKRSRTENNLSQ